MSKKELFVLDMGGTTIEVGDHVTSAFAAALEKNGVSAGEEEISERMGASKREVIRFFVSRRFGTRPDESARIETAYRDFGEVLLSRFADGGVRPIAGVEAALSLLREQGHKVALTTGFDRRVTDFVLRAVGWHEGFVDASVCDDDVAWGRPAPFMIFGAMERTGVFDVRQVNVVGDTVLDLRAGHNAGARRVVGVLSGSHDLEQLGRTRHTHLIPSAAELPRLLGDELYHRAIRPDGQGGERVRGSYRHGAVSPEGQAVKT